MFLTRNHPPGMNLVKTQAAIAEALDSNGVAIESAGAGAALQRRIQTRTQPVVFVVA